MSNLGHGRGPFQPFAFFLPTVIAVAGSVPGSESSAPNYQIAPVQTSVVYLYSGDDFVPQQAPAFVSDEDEIAQFVLRSSRSVQQPIAYEDEIVPQPVAQAVFDGDDWQITLPARIARPSQSPFLDEEFVPQVAPSFISDQDENYWQIALPARRTSIAQALATDDGYAVPTCEEEIWVFSPRSAIGRPQVFWADDELPIAAGAPSLTYEEDAAAVILLRASRITQPFAIDDEIIPQGAPPPLVFEDDFWSVRLAKLAPTQVRAASADDDIVPQPALTLAFEEERWPIASLRTVVSIRLIVSDEDVPTLAATHPADFTGELTVNPRFSGQLSTLLQFSGELNAIARFSGIITADPRFSGILLVTPEFEGELEVRPG